MSLVAERVSLQLSGRAILDNVSLDLEPGRLTIAIGPNGAGKTTLLRLLCGDLAPSSGCVRLDGERIDRLSGEALARRRAVLPQSSHVAFPLTVYEVVALGMGGRSAADRRSLPLAMLAKVGLRGYEGRFYQTLSGGERQRVQLARVLCQIDRPVAGGEPRWLFLDEPVSSLDVGHQFAILDIARAHADAGGGCFAILHDLNLASLYADCLVVMSKGRIAARGAPEDVLSDRLLDEVFGVSLRVNKAPAKPQRPYVLPHRSDA